MFQEWLISPNHTGDPYAIARLQYTKVSENIENWVNFGDIESQ
jgi:hypothetical protein